MILETLINQHLEKKQEINQRPMRNVLHPSTIGMCERKIALEMLMIPAKLDEPRSLRIFDNGHSMHERFETWFQEMGILIQAEMKIEIGQISGRTDAWIKIPHFAFPEGLNLLVELKSASYKSFMRMKESNKPKEEHRAQLMFYMHLTGIHAGIILVENKDNQELWEHHMNYDPAFGFELEAKATRIIDLVNQRMVPPIPKYHTASSYKCSYCPFTHLCHTNSIKQDGSQRYPIPFVESSVLYEQSIRIIKALAMNEPIPDLMHANNKGEWVTHVLQHKGE